MTRNLIAAALYALLLLSGCGAGCWDGLVDGASQGAHDGWEAGS